MPEKIDYISKQEIDEITKRNPPTPTLDEWIKMFHTFHQIEDIGEMQGKLDERLYFAEYVDYDPREYGVNINPSVDWKFRIIRFKTGNVYSYAFQNVSNYGSPVEIPTFSFDIMDSKGIKEFFPELVRYWEERKDSSNSCTIGRINNSGLTSMNLPDAIVEVALVKEDFKDEPRLRIISRDYGSQLIFQEGNIKNLGQPIIAPPGENSELTPIIPTEKDNFELWKSVLSDENAITDVFTGPIPMNIYGNKDKSKIRIIAHAFRYMDEDDPIHISGADFWHSLLSFTDKLQNEDGTKFLALDKSKYMRESEYWHPMTSSVSNRKFDGETIEFPTGSGNLIPPDDNYHTYTYGQFFMLDNNWNPTHSGRVIVDDYRLSLSFDNINKSNPYASADENNDVRLLANPKNEFKEYGREGCAIGLYFCIDLDMVWRDI
jgi:hypothetical protein